MYLLLYFILSKDHRANEVLGIGLTHEENNWWTL